MTKAAAQPPARRLWFYSLSGSTTIKNALRVALRIDSGIMILIWISAKPAELIGAKPLHLLTQTALPLKSLTGAFIAAQTRSWLKCFFTGGVVAVNCICNSDRPLTIAAPPVKIAFGAARRPRQTRNKNNLSAEDGQSNAEAILNRPPSLLHFWGKRCRIQSQSNTGELVQRAERKYSKLRPFYLMRIMPP